MEKEYSTKNKPIIVIAGLTRNPLNTVKHLLTNFLRLRVKPAMTRLRKPTMTIACILFVFSLGIQAQNIVSPLDTPLFLSGNFGELRHNHFHSGIDFKTQGRTGLPVKSVKKGYIARISVSPYGYGRAVYINHPDGTTSVYGHLNHFAPEIESAVRDSQYLKESFAVNLTFASADFPIKQGAVFAYSGNTGGSGGPHLHFEFRQTAADKPFDPLPAFKNQIKDSKAPEIRGIMIFPVAGKGVVNGSSNNQSFDLVKNKLGKPAVGAAIKAWGEIGIGIKAYDRMDETSNIYGVYEISLKSEGKEIYHSVMDAFAFEDTRYINTYIDWTDWIENSSFYMKSFIEPGNRLEIYHLSDNGIISIDEEKTYSLEYRLKDVFGNTQTFSFRIAGEKRAIPPIPSSEIYFRFNEDNEYKGKGIELKIPRNNLYTDLCFDVDTIGDYSPFAPLYVLGKRIPLHTYCPLTLTILNDIYPDKSKYGIVQIYKNKKTWLGGEYKKSRITADIRELGSLSIQIDTLPPVITPINPAKWTINKRLSFKITDNLSGIKSYEGRLNGQFVLFEYDAKTNSLFCVYDSKRMGKGKQTLNLIVADGAGNSSGFSEEILF